MNLTTTPSFLRHLWLVCRTLKYETDYRYTSISFSSTPSKFNFSLFSEQVLLLLHISCASSLLKDVDIDRIEPLLVTFCSLYSMSLVPLHDDEFFRGPPETAFRMNEISDMVKILRDVCMGIVRFMYPEKQLNTQITSTLMNTIDDNEANVKINRIQKQTEVARQKSSKFSRVFKVNQL